MTLSMKELEKLEALNEQGNLELVCFEEHIWPFAERTPATVFDILLTMAKRSLELEAENEKLRDTIAAQSKRIEELEKRVEALKGLKQYIKHDGDLTWEAIDAIFFVNEVLK